MAAYLQQHLVYPPTALEAEVEGTVHLKYDIDHKGKVVGVEIINGIGHGCDEEAERLVRGMEFTVPKKARGLRIIYHKNLKVNFHLPKKKAVNPPTTGDSLSTSGITYTIVPKSPEPAQKSTSGNGYSYQITIGNHDQ